MKKYYLWSLFVNLIPILTTYIILHDCTGDGCFGKFLIWFTIPIWALIYLLYFTLNKKENETYLKKVIIIYSPTLIATCLSIIWTVINDEEIDWFIYTFLILFLPTFIYNIFVEYKLNRREILNIRNRMLFHPITLLILITMLITIFYRPSFYEKDVFAIGQIEVTPSLSKIESYLSDSTTNKYLLPRNIKVLPYPDYKEWIDEDDYFLYLKDKPTEVIHIKINNTSKPLVEIKGIKTLKEKYTWEWRVKVKKNDEEAIRVLNRIDKTLKEIDPTIRTRIKNHAP